MNTNQALWERIGRVILGLVLVSLVFVGPQTAWGYLGAIPLLTGLVGFCPLYHLFGVSSRGPSRLQRQPH
jgi:hypothetical protein